MEEFLDSLNAKQAQKVLWVLKVVQELPRVPIQYLKKLEGPDDLWEVRAEFGGEAFRLLGFWNSGRWIVLTDGFAKKTQKTPDREIALAEQRKRADKVFAKDFDAGYVEFKIGVRLREAREQAGVTQAALAKITQTKKSALSRRKTMPRTCGCPPCRAWRGRWAKRCGLNWWKRSDLRMQ